MRTTEMFSNHLVPSCEELELKTLKNKSLIYSRIIILLILFSCSSRQVNEEKKVVNEGITVPNFLSETDREDSISFLYVNVHMLFDRFSGNVAVDWLYNPNGSGIDGNLAEQISRVPHGWR